MSETRESATEAFRQAIRAADAAKLRTLLEQSAEARALVNQPLFDFGGRAINAGAAHLDVLDVLVGFGADINLKSDWEKGPFGILDTCPEELAGDLIARGATLTACSAARFGWRDALQKLLAANPAAVHEKGGDGQRPLHFAKAPEIADFLLDHGAAIDARCDDHDSTAAQYALVDRPDVTRRLLERGAAADIFMAARLGDVELARQLIAQGAGCVAARTHQGGYAPVAAFGIYNWTLGFHVSPQEVALGRDHRDVFDLLIQHSPPKVRLLDAAMRADADAARAALAESPDLVRGFTDADHALLAFATLNEHTAAVRLMLDLGFSLLGRGMDGGTPLHMAAWMGNADLIVALLAHGAPIDIVDTTHGSTPVAWAAFGSVHRRAGNYAAAIEALIHGGADLRLPGNRSQRTLVQMAEGNADIQSLLRRHGAD